MASTQAGYLTGTLKIPGISQTPPDDDNVTILSTVAQSLPTVGSHKMQMQEYSVTTERRLPKGEELKPETGKRYESRFRQIVVAAIEFDITTANLGRLNRFMKARLVKRVDVQNGSENRNFNLSGDVEGWWRMDLARVTEDRTGTATLLVQLSRYSIWETDPRGAAVAVL